MTLKLTYFDMPCCAEAIRSTLWSAGLVFQDGRISREELETPKTSFLYGKLPVLEAYGELLVESQVIRVESQVILWYIARLGGLYPPSDDLVAAALVDEVIWRSVCVNTGRLDGDAGVRLSIRPRWQRHIRARTQKSGIEHKLRRASSRPPMPSLTPPLLLSVALVALAVVYQLQLLDPSPPALKLTYFDGPGRAEASRVAFRLGGVSFHDERLAHDVFLQLKPTLPYGQVPALTVEGEVLAESQAILRFAARLGGSYPSDHALAMLLTEEILATLDEISETKISPVRWKKFPQRQTELENELVATVLPAAFKLLERRLKFIARVPYFLKDGDKVWVHEIAVWRFLDYFVSGTIAFVPASILDHFPTLSAIHAKVAAAQDEQPSVKHPSLPEEVVKPLAAPAKLKVTYFDIKGRAEFIRLALTIGGIPFEDERLSRDAFLELKPTLPNGQVPVMTVDGHVVAQSFGLLRYAGALGGLYPTRIPFAALKIDEIIARVENIGYLFYWSGKEQDQAKKRAMREELAADALPKALAALEKRVVYWNKGSKFVFGDAMTVADLAIFQLVQSYKSGSLDFIPATLIDEYSALVQVNQAVLEHPRVVEWYAKRG